MDIVIWPRSDKYMINKLEEPYDEPNSMILFTLIPTFREPKFDQNVTGTHFECGSNTI
jgi:hypothetical protein